LANYNAPSFVGLRECGIANAASGPAGQKGRAAVVFLFLAFEEM
jgi:hypothetical protein